MRASHAIIVFRDRDELIDWRMMGQALPGGSIPLEITWLVDGRIAETVELHGYIDDNRQRIVDARNVAIEEMEAHGAWR